MPKGRGSNDRRRNGRQLAARYRDEYSKNTTGTGVGYYKLMALYERALAVQKKRRDQLKKLRAPKIKQGIKIR